MRFAAATVLLVILSCAKNQVTASGDWCYEEIDCGPSHWGGTCKTGKSQSPIDFNSTAAALADKTNRRIRFDSAYFKVHEKFYILNNGHSIQVQLNENAISSCLMDGFGFKGSYVFAQMHFHWGSNSNVGSEHTIDGKHYPMELHLVHFSDKYTTLTNALQDSNRRAVAVLGVFFEITAKDNPAMDSIIRALPSVYSPEETFAGKPAVGRLNLTELLPSVLDLWRYEGSLTTPACAEKVVWTVFRKPIGISEKQLNHFRAAKDSHGKPLVNNYRPTQAIARRPIKFFSIDRMQEKNDESSNEIDDTDHTEDFEHTTNNISDHDPDNHGNGIDHEQDSDHVHHGATDFQPIGGNQTGNNGGKGSAGLLQASSSIIHLVLSSFLCFTLSKWS